MASCLFSNSSPNAFAADSGDYYGHTWPLNNGVLKIEIGDNTKDATTRSFQYAPFVERKAEIKKIIIGDGFDEIRSNSFREYPNLEEVIFPKSMGAQIANYAFYNCPKLKKIQLPELGLSRIGKYAFYGTAIKKVELPIFTDWIDEHAFNDDTVIVKLKEQEGIIAAGTAGVKGYPLYNNYDAYHPQVDDGLNTDGDADLGTCYNKYHAGYYYDDTAYWKLDKDGTLTIWGSDLIRPYESSRQPWSCYAKDIKKIIFNDDKTGKLTKSNKINNSQKLSNAKYAIYASKPVEDIMKNRIRIIQGSSSYFWHCGGSYYCTNGTRNLETVVINRGVEIIGESAIAGNGGSPIKDVYISKYVKTIGGDQFWNVKDDYDEKVHVEVSIDDYIENNYSYANFAYNSKFFDYVEVRGGGYTACFQGSYKCAKIINDIDPYYVSINDTSAPNTITHNGKTLYKYETYITKDDGSVDVSLPNMDDVDYYVKEIEAPEGFQVDPETYQVDMSGKNVDIQVADYPIGYKDPKQAKTEKNPNTATAQPVIYFILFGALAAGVTLSVRRVVIIAKGK